MYVLKPRVTYLVRNLLSRGNTALASSLLVKGRSRGCYPNQRSRRRVTSSHSLGRSWLCKASPSPAPTRSSLRHMVHAFMLLVAIGM